MGMEVKGQAVLAQIAKSPSAFGMSSAQINALATATLLARLKDKAAGLDVIRSIVKAIGSDDFSVILDHLSDKDASTFSKRLDPKNPSTKSADVPWQRQHIVSLAKADTEPMIAAPKAPKPVSPTSRSRKPKTGDVMESKALKPRAPRKAKTGA